MALALHHSGKIVKCDQKVDITATFGSDLVLEGYSHSKHPFKGIQPSGYFRFSNASLIQLIRFTWRKGRCPSPRKCLLKLWNQNLPGLEWELQDLLDKEIIAVSQFYDRDLGYISRV